MDEEYAAGEEVDADIVQVCKAVTARPEWPNWHRCSPSPKSARAAQTVARDSKRLPRPPNSSRNLDETSHASPREVSRDTF